jgi:hypothetical protein
MRMVQLSVLAAAVSIALPASAEEQPPFYTPEAQQTRIGVEVDLLHFHGETASSSFVGGDLVAQIGVTRHVFIDADLPMGVFAGKFVREGLLGTPTVGAHYAGHFTRRTSGYVGLAIGIPVAGATNPHREDELGGWATWARAWHDPYRFLPKSLPVIARAGLEADLAPMFVRAELSPGLITDVRHPTAIGYVDTAATLGLRARFGLEGGVQGLGTFVFSSPGPNAQIAIEPFVGYTSPGRPGLYARYGLLAALNVPLGIGGEGVVTHRFSIGAKL